MSPTITKMEVWPVAGQDCMELNLSGAHAPYFTRNVVVLYADNGETGVGEVPGGQKITKALEECKMCIRDRAAMPEPVRPMKHGKGVPLMEENYNGRI